MPDNKLVKGLQNKFKSRPTLRAQFAAFGINSYCGARRLMRRFGKEILVVHSSLTTVGQKLCFSQPPKNRNDKQQTWETHGGILYTFSAFFNVAIRIHDVGTPKENTNHNGQHSEPEEVSGSLVVASQLRLRNDARHIAMTSILRSSLGKGSIEGLGPGRETVAKTVSSVCAN